MQVVKCKFCDGTGKVGEIFSGYKPCPTCYGAGEFFLDVHSDSFIPCKFCGNTGKTGDVLSGYRPCEVCKGIGILKRPTIRLSPKSNISSPGTQPRPSSQQYDIAISFAREDREIVREYAEHLKKSSVSVFFDEYEQADLWGKDLYAKLDEIYRKRAKYCVIFISEHYATKLWTNHERKSAQARAFTENREYILPVKLDNTEIPALPETVGYLDLRKISISQPVQLTLSKLKK